MIYRILLSSVTIFTLVTCQNQNTPNERTKPITTSGSNSTAAPIKETSKTSESLPSGDKVVKIKEQKQADTKKKNVVYFKEGENKFLKEYEMNVTFKSMVEDSRCPKDVKCIWAGNAMAEVEFMGLYTRPVILRFSTMNDASKNYFNTQKFNGYSISLVDVSPETTSAKGFKDLKGTYRIALQFDK